ncbi:MULTISPECIES: hypothetical protein [unclassified Pseudomonas]|uniref:hypothetical protein n=1 Tax=unclassified Pseudomonas TaxID=196821 RepID=UPI0030DD2868
MTVILCGLGGCLPPQIVDNQQISSGLDTTPEWIESRTGIRERRMVSDGLSMLDLAIKAGARALASADGRAVQAVVVATTSPERICPAVAPQVASALGLGGGFTQQVFDDFELRGSLAFDLDPPLHGDDW